MNTLDCIAERRTVRKFKKIPVEWYKIGKILEAGLCAPSAGNLQDFRLMVVTDEGKRKNIAHFCMDQLWMVNAPVYIVVSSTFIKTQRFYGIRGERLYSIQSAAAAAQNILLAANDLELGSAWIGAFDEDSIKDILKIPDYARVQVIIPVGYPDEIPPRPPKFNTVDMVHFNYYGDNSGKVTSLRAEMLKEWSPIFEGIVDKVKNTMDKGTETANDAGAKIGSKIGEHAKNLHKNIKDKLTKNKK